MSNPGGFSRLRIGDGGTLWMARGEGDLRSNMNEDLPYPPRMLMLLGS